MEKLKAIVHYFHVATDESECAKSSFYPQPQPKEPRLRRLRRRLLLLTALPHVCCVETKLDGLVTFERRCLANTDARTWSW